MKPVSKINIINVMKTHGSIMQVKSTAVCSTVALEHSAVLLTCIRSGAFCSTFDLH